MTSDKQIPKVSEYGGAVSAPQSEVADDLGKPAGNLPDLPTVSRQHEAI